MERKLNKNGIPILDPPNENKQRKKRICLPDEHNWIQAKDLTNRVALKRKKYECTNCDEIIFEKEVHDEDTGEVFEVEE